MLTITLQNEVSADVVSAIKSLLGKVPKEHYSIDESDYLSEADKARLKETYELVKAGKMEFLSLEELQANLAQKGYEW